LTTPRVPAGVIDHPPMPQFSSSQSVMHVAIAEAVRRHLDGDPHRGNWRSTSAMIWRDYRASRSIAPSPATGQSSGADSAV
jgi:hypothetical protein